jgi:hypothetical protein
MATEDVVRAMQQAALHAAQCVKPLADTPDTRAAYARGVRAMAGLVHACISVTERTIEEHRGDPLAVTMFTGYSRALRNIVDASEDLIPPGYE